ncbi:MAG: 50S ribosomal protein L10 [bacterium]|nr:50S ribosomal protein L10 [bacterium]
MLTRPQKEKIVEELSDKLSKQKIAVFTDFRGVSVAKAQILRRQLKTNEAEFKVAKKTLFDLALAKTESGLKTKDLEGEIGLALGYGDQVGLAKTLAKFAKENETFKILKAILGGKIIDGKDILKLAKLPSREVLLAQLLGVLQSPAQNLVRVLNGNIRNLVVVLNKIKDKK